MHLDRHLGTHLDKSGGFLTAYTRQSKMGVVEV
jgi:hypothetical protein